MNNTNAAVARWTAGSTRPQWPNVGGLARLAGVNIRRLRRERGLSQEVLGDRSGVDFKYIGAVERGEANFTIGVLERVAKALGIEPFELLRPIAGPSTTRKSSGDLYMMLADLDQRGAVFVRDVLEVYLADRAGSGPGQRRKPTR